jgi:hypothetical protein
MFLGGDHKAVKRLERPRSAFSAGTPSDGG